ncbi:MAG: hypothetical protein J5960_02420 [Desulfovibrio sp.]|jgi:hypothetical protein|nr:hypothetical protein [Desulfovibrio sp.]
MLEAAASPAYKDLLDALGKLAQWTEEAGKGSLPSGPPSAELVRQFNEALQTALERAQGAQAMPPAQGATPAEAAQPAMDAPRMEAAWPADTAQPAENAARPQEVAMVREETPPDLIGESGLFQSGEKPVRPVDSQAAAEDREGTGQRREVGAMTEAQEINLDRGLDALGSAADARHSEFYRAARQLSDLLARPAAEISPLDLLQAQRLVGVLKVQSESGRKVSEGVSDTLEQLLEQQG